MGCSVAMVRLMLIYYVNFIAFMKNHEKTWNDFLAKEMQKERQNQVFSIVGLTFEKIDPEVQFYWTSGRIFMLFGVLPDSNKRKMNRWGNITKINEFKFAYYSIPFLFIRTNVYPVLSWCYLYLTRLFYKWISHVPHSRFV